MPSWCRRDALPRRRSTVGPSPASAAAAGRPLKRAAPSHASSGGCPIHVHWNHCPVRFDGGRASGLTADGFVGINPSDGTGMANSPTVRLAAPLPPRTRARPRFFAVLVQPAVLPAVTSCRKASISSRVTAATLSEPGNGLMCRSMRPRSVASVLAFFAVRRRVISHAPDARYRPHNWSTVAALRLDCLSRRRRQPHPGAASPGRGLPR